MAIQWKSSELDFQAPAKNNDVPVASRSTINGRASDCFWYERDLRLNFDLGG
jgi:hypothetical protein